MDAMQRVIGTTELLEKILLRLPMRSLLHTQRVCKSWKQVITTSPSLQQALFFRAKGQFPRSNSEDEKQEAELNPLLVWLFPPFFETHAFYGWLSFRNLAQFNNMHFNFTDSTRSAVLRGDASWRKMLPTQPPPEDLAINLRMHGQGGESIRSGRLVKEELIQDGIRMGIIYDIAEKHFRHLSSCSFFIRWHNHALLPGKVVVETAGHPERTQFIKYEACHDVYGGRELRSKVTVHLWSSRSCVLSDRDSKKTPVSEACQDVQISYGDQSE
jgi:hypothetical protein